jgi:hypothetical protein
MSDKIECECLSGECRSWIRVGDLGIEIHEEFADTAGYHDSEIHFTEKTLGEFISDLVELWKDIKAGGNT